MPYFPIQPKPKPYKCEGCGGWYFYSNMSCTVLHSPGSCCHYYEEQYDAERQTDGFGQKEGEEAQKTA